MRVPDGWRQRNRVIAEVYLGEFAAAPLAEYSPMKRTLLLVGLLLAASAGGCINPKERFGRTWYLDGAGNWGFGVLEVPIGLQKAGYRGQVSNHHWSITMNPALDQTLRFLARGAGRNLGRKITAYLKRNPNADANIIALSAGTGVGIWAIESVKPPYKVNNFIMLGSSLSSKYNMRKALKHMKGNIYVYYARNDPILSGPVRAIGTIDGTFDDPAGLVGLRGPGVKSGRIKNISCKPKYAALGWTGGHVDCVGRRFVAAELKKWIVPRPNKPRHVARQAEVSAIRKTSAPQTIISASDQPNYNPH